MIHFLYSVFYLHALNTVFKVKCSPESDRIAPIEQISDHAKRQNNTAKK